MAVPTPANGCTPEPEEGLTPEQLAAFQRDGYLIVPDALPPATVAAMLAETRRLLDEFSLENHPLTRFRTGGDSSSGGRGEEGKGEHVGDDYFLGSGDKVRFFFEEDAFDGEGKLVRPKARAINKIGHYLHGLNPVFASLLANPPPPPASSEVLAAAAGEAAAAAQEPERSEAPNFVRGMKARPAAVARALGFRDPRCLQSMVICKQPEIGGAVPPHQDSTFLYTDPPSAVGFWYALEDATAENGCLSFLPGSHRWAPVVKRLVRRDGGRGGTAIVDNPGGAEFPPGAEYGVPAPSPHERSEEKEKGYVMGEVKAGTLVLIHGNLLHKSEKNLSQKGRIIYTFHVIEGDGTEYDARNWLQPPAEGFTRLYA